MLIPIEDKHGEWASYLRRNKIKTFLYNIGIDILGEYPVKGTLVDVAYLHVYYKVKKCSSPATQ